MDKEYYLGLDMGTSTVGWAVTDTKYNLLKFKGKDMWGVREFDEALVSVERRTNRISRRRRQRQQVRIGMIYDYFHDEIAKVDPDFYQRLENSKYHLEDKDENVRYKYSIFNDENYTDSDYYKQYPTIFHLRKELIENLESHDVRLVFLAVLNMFKRRGHFLNAGLNADAGSDIESVYNGLNETLAAFYDDIELPSGIDFERLKLLITDKDSNRTKKSENLLDFLGINKKTDKIKLNLIKAICGLSFKLKDIFEGIELENEAYSVKFSDFSYTEKETEIIQMTGEERFKVIESLKNFYDSTVLLEILGGNANNYLSFSRVEQYEKHKRDLRLLKDVIRQYSSEEYDDIFRNETDSSYSAYVKSFNSGKKIRRSFKNRKRDDLYKRIKKLMEGLKKDNIEDERIDYILKEIDKESFLPKQLTSENGVIPNQIHCKELKKILENASLYLDFLNDIDESGLSTKERIIQLFEFQIPYYIGPLSDMSEKNNGNGWVVRKEAGKVLPWNINEKVDIEATSEKFIERLIRRCTYISGEKVMPKQSLLYEKYCVLNEINNIRIRDERITPELKKEIFNDLFCSGKKVTKKGIIEYLVSRNKISEAGEISGIDTNINNQLNSYGKFLPIFGDKIMEDNYKNIIEDIIRDATIYGDSKKRLKDVLVKKYKQEKNILDDTQIKRILGFKFKDWGRISKEFLMLTGCKKSTGEVFTLIDALMEDQLNMMELINSEDYTFKEALAEKKNTGLKCLSEFKVEDLDEYYFSAPVKRMVWQTILVIKEIEKITGKPPKKLFIEMTRHDEEKGDKGRKDSRAKMLLELYKKTGEDISEWEELINSAENSGKLKSKKMFLYLIQMGKSMYTGEQIDLDELFDDNKYDIDHIYPRSLVKDDNISNNLVLVEKQYNANKTNDYPLDIKIRNNPKVFTHWKYLRDHGFINEEKYRRLTSANGFSDDQLSGFIARQIVETNQATKAVADLISGLLQGQTEIVYSKAGNVSDFRRNGLMKKRDDNEEHFMFPKSRLINDFHHANDAYLNIVVGNAYNVKFTKNPYNYIKNAQKKKDDKNNGKPYNIHNILRWDIERNGEVGWVANPKEGEEKSIDIVKRTMAKNTPIITRMNFVGHGQIANATLYGHEKASASNYVPLKSSDNKMSDVTKYGGFTSVKIAYMFVVEHDGKKGRIRTLETLPIMYVNQIKDDKKKLEDYCKTVLNLKNPDIRFSKIKIQSLFKIDGYFAHVTGKTGNQYILKNYVSMCLNKEWVEYIKILENYIDKGSNLSGYINSEKNIELYRLIADKHLNSIYSKKPNPMGEKLKNKLDYFSELDHTEQTNVILEILKLTAFGNGKCDLTGINESKNSGMILVSKDISSKSEFLLINQSVTGLFENYVDLKTV